MPVKRIELYGLVILSILAICGTIAYIGQVKDVSSAEQMKSDVKAQIESMKQELAGKLSEIQKDKAEVKTPEQVVQRIPQYIEVPKPIFVQPAQTQTSSLPDAPIPQIAKPGDLVIPQESAQAFFQQAATCKENELKLSNCSQQLKLVGEESQKWEKAAKGGSWLSRTKTKIIWLGIGAGAGYALSKR